MITVAVSCKTDTTSNTSEHNIEEAIAAPRPSNDPVVLNTIKMLQGNWVSRSDKNTSITFENNTRIETRDGKTLGKMRYFEIADQCNNDTAPDKKIVKAKAKYISMLDIDMCYYIKRITKNELILSYVGRDNTLIYTRGMSSNQKVNTSGKLKIKSKDSKN